MGEWPVDTPWRQGHILNAETASQLGLESKDPLLAAVVVVISHDCDLARHPVMEPDCEVIVGHTIETINGAYTWAKNTRRLHLPFSGGVTKIAAEFFATAKQRVSKAGLADHSPLSSVALNANEFTILQSWLSSRYRRAS